MKKTAVWGAFALAVMLGLPWLTVTYTGSAGMMLCLLLFFAVNPLFLAAVGLWAGRDVARRWPLPLATAGLFILGAWLFFEVGDPAFLGYGGVYALLGMLAMLISALIKSKK